MSTPTGDKSRKGDLTIRLMSAAVLIPLALFMVWYGGAFLAVGCIIFGATMGYEWTRMTNSPTLPVMIVCGAAPTLLALLLSHGIGLLAVVVFAALAGFVHPGGPRQRLMSAFGAMYASGLPLSLFLLRSGDWDGQAAALLVMAIVWASDSGAYFAGRNFGGPLLAPKDSPSKTWSGAIGAVIACALAGLLASFILGASPFGWILAGIAISICSQWGDLFESSLKRRFGTKDASGLLPGHGGVMDRVDGLGMACIMAVLALGLDFGLGAMLGLTA